MGIRAISPKRRADYGSPPCDRTIISGYFNERDLEIFFELIQHRCQLPVFHGDFWRCYNCGFETGDFQKIAVHIMEVHRRTHQKTEKTQREFIEV